MNSQHNLYGPPLKSIYSKKTWTSRIPAESLTTSASASESSKKKSQRQSEASFFSARNQAERAPDDVVNAIFKGIPVGGSHNGQAQNEAAAFRAAAARRSREELAATAPDSHTRTLRHKASQSPERTRPRVRTVSSASSLSKKSERSFSFALFKEKDKHRGKAGSIHQEKEMDKGKGKKSSNKSGSSAELDSLAATRKQDLS